MHLKWMSGVGVALLAATAMAQGDGGQAFDKTEKPLKVFGGLFDSTSNLFDASSKSGFTFGFGYKAWENQNGIVEFEARGTFFQIRNGGSRDTLAQVGVYTNFVLKPTRDLFIGFGPGFITGEVTVDGDRFGSKGAVAFHGFLGYNFKKDVFGQVRLTSGGDSAGFSVEVGFRF